MTYSRTFNGTFKVEAPNYGFATTVTVTPPELLLHIDHTGRHVLNGLGEYVGTLVYETADPTLPLHPLATRRPPE